MNMTSGRLWQVLNEAQRHTVWQHLVLVFGYKQAPSHAASKASAAAGTSLQRSVIGLFREQCTDVPASLHKPWLMAAYKFAWLLQASPSPKQAKPRAREPRGGLLHCQTPILERRAPRHPKLDLIKNSHCGSH